MAKKKTPQVFTLGLTPDTSARGKTLQLQQAREASPQMQVKRKQEAAQKGRDVKAGNIVRVEQVYQQKQKEATTQLQVGLLGDAIKLDLSQIQYPSYTRGDSLKTPGELGLDAYRKQQRKAKEEKLKNLQKARDIKNIQEGYISSSNVAAISFNYETEQLYIKFHSGAVYEYDLSQVADGVKVALNVITGDAMCKTSGQNQYGKWWVRKTPSLGAAVWKYLRNSGIPYKKVRGAIPKPTQAVQQQTMNDIAAQVAQQVSDLSSMPTKFDPSFVKQQNIAKNRQKSPSGILATKRESIKKARQAKTFKF